GDNALPLTGPPDGGMAWMVHRWASGQSLDAVLRDQDMAAGDFVRRCKQLVDLMDQIADAAPTPQLRATARKAVIAVLRGVVAAGRLARPCPDEFRAPLHQRAPATPTRGPGRAL